MSKKVYLAHPISTTGEFNDSIRVAKEIESLGYEVYAPALNKEINDKRNNPTPKMIFEQDLEKLINADIVVLNYTGGDANGTLLELGMLVGGFTELLRETAQRVCVYTSNQRALQPQHHNGIPSGKLNHMVLGAIDACGFDWLSTEKEVMEHLKELKEYEE